MFSEVGNDLQSYHKILENKINEYIQTQEYQNLICINFNMNQPNGADIFDMILRMSNDEFDFDDLKRIINKLVHRQVFFNDERIEKTH